jgi:hypothetical protein
MGDIIAIYDCDDEDMLNLLEVIEKEADVKSIKLNEAESSINVFESLNHLSIEQGEIEIRQQDFQSASLVIYRRWRMQETPFFKCTHLDGYERRFAEREWSSFMSGVLAKQEFLMSGQVTWMNPPSKSGISKNKYFLLAVAKELDLLTPPFFCSNNFVGFKRVRGSEFVAKSISSDEQIHDDLYYRTAKLSLQQVEDILEYRNACPTFLQNRLSVGIEVRTYYCLGDLFSVRISFDKPYEDIRFVDVDRIDVQPEDIPSSVAKKIKNLCKAVGLNFCTLDFIVQDNEYWLVDVTANGSWGTYDRKCEEWLSKKIISAILNHGLDSY